MKLKDASQIAETPTVKTDITPPPRVSGAAQSTSNVFPHQSTLKPRPGLRSQEASGSETTPWGAYELIRPLGHGAMGSVYEARDPVLDRCIALKILAATSANNGQRGVEACLAEARVAAKLDHPNIVTVFQIGEHEGTGFIAMQLVRGGSAVDRLPLSVGESLRVVRAVADALGYAHRQGVVHRDVKPENILLGEDGSVKLADFGLAQSVAVEESGLRSGRIAGTPAFMSPEQAQGLPLDGRSDLYSLGATWFAMLAGEPPFVRPGMMEVLFAHVETPPADVRSFRPQVPAAVAELIVRLLSKKPEDRPATAQELVTAIDTINQTLAPRASTKVRPGRPHRLHWVLAASLVFVGFGLAIASGTYLANRENEKARAGETVGLSIASDTSVADGLSTINPLPPDERYSPVQTMKEPSPPALPEASDRAATGSDTPVGSGTSQTENTPPLTTRNVSGRLPVSLFGSLMAAAATHPPPTGMNGGLPYFGYPNHLKKPPSAPQVRLPGDKYHHHQ
jgi:serine/threonine protein kinase